VKALVLAGGFGTRLAGVVRDLPKPLAPVAGRPFLHHLLLWLAHHGIRDVVLSTGHLAEKVVASVGDGRALGLSVEYSHESSPAGTGGAVKLAAPLLDTEDFLVMNGDSFVDVDIGALVEAHRERSALCTMVLAKVADISRYGRVEVDVAGRVTRFEEKGAASGSGLINAGVYVLRRDVLDRIERRDEPVSLEREVFPALIGDAFYGHAVDAFFVDIGVPEDYRALCESPEPLFGGEP
jgi:NDP-sugar pyrophosphorylase family protein